MPRRKRAVIESSDVESDVLRSPQTPKKVAKGAIEAAFARAQTNAGINASPGSASVQKKLPLRDASTRISKSKATSKAVSASVGQSPSKTKPILSFFNSATQRQSLRHSKSPDKISQHVLGVEDDAISDSSDDVQDASSIRSDGRGTKRKLLLDDESSSAASSARAQKFLRLTPVPGSQATRLSTPAQRHDQRPWTEQYGPVDLDELAVHKRKVQDVRQWLSSVISGDNRKRLLVLKGPAGSGKTATVRLLSKEMSLLVTEWHNPESTIATGTKDSLAAQFDDFIARTSTFGTLSFEESVHLAQPSRKGDRDQIILMEEFPNTYSQTSTVLQGFRRAVLQYLTTASPPDTFFPPEHRQNVLPIIMTVSESLLTTSTAASDSFTAHRLLGSEILSHPGTSVMDFNVIAPSFMSKALDLILTKEARKSGRRFAPGHAVLKHLSDIGDIRSAVSALEFFCLHQGGEADWSGKIQFTKGKRKIGHAEPTQMERQSLELITQRENTLGIFHAVGKVVYNKREVPVATDTPPPQPGPWLPQFHRHKVSVVNVDALLNELGTDIHVFILALHENYVLSCQDLEAEATLDSLTGCLDSLSDADLLCPDRFASNQSRFAFAGTTTDALRQDEISFDTCVRGILFNLPHPVKRATPPSNYAAGRGKHGRDSTGFQMLYPTFLRLWKKKEQLEGLVELFNEDFRRGRLDRTLVSKRESSAVAGGVLSWRKQGWTEAAGMTADESVEPEQPSSSLLRGASKSELLLERLPYVLRIDRGKSQLRSHAAKQISRVVTFSGLVNILNDNEEESQEALDAGGEEQWSTDKPAEQSPQKRRGEHAVVVQAKDKLDVNDEIDRLVLSDDDIEDD